MQGDINVHLEKFGEEHILVTEWETEAFTDNDALNPLEYSFAIGMDNDRLKINAFSIKKVNYSISQNKNIFTIKITPFILHRGIITIVYL